MLLKGMVSVNARWNEIHRNWEYVVSGVDCDGVPLAVVIALVPRIFRLTVITVKDTNE